MALGQAESSEIYKSWPCHRSHKMMALTKGRRYLYMQSCTTCEAHTQLQVAACNSCQATTARGKSFRDIVTGLCKDARRAIPNATGET